METLEAELARAHDLDPAALADAIESIGFECTRCGACCTGHGEEEHVATVFPDEVRELVDADEGGTPTTDDGGKTSDDRREWRDVARPMPFGLHEGETGLEGETFEWSLATDGCGDCTFYEETGGQGACTVHEDRPLICQTYPFSVALAGTSQPMGEAVGEAGMVRAHECEGLGRDIDREDAEELARTLKERAIRELGEAIAVRDNYEPVDADPGAVVVHDSEGVKWPDGTPVDQDSR